MGEDEAREREVEARVDRWLAAVERAKHGSWVVVADAGALPDDIRAESQYWCDSALAPEMNPYDVPGCVHAYHLATPETIDLLRHEYSVDGRAITVFEGRNFLCVEPARPSLDVLALPEESRAEAIHQLGRDVLREEESAPRPEGDIVEGTRVCSNTSVDPQCLCDPLARVDGVVRGGALSLVCYKKPAQRIGFANPSAWFGEDLRKGA